MPTIQELLIAHKAIKDSQYVTQPRQTEIKTSALASTQAPQRERILQALANLKRTTIPEMVQKDDKETSQGNAESEQNTGSQLENRTINGSSNDESQEDSNDADLLDKEDVFTTTDKNGNVITYNAKQKEFIDLALSGQSCILIGPAGTGKTTAMKGVMQSLIEAGMAPIMNNHNHKYLPQGVPGISVSAYTRRATNNIRKNLSLDMQGNAITIHKLLEYEPVYYETTDESTGKTKNTMSFEPRRNSTFRLPESLHVCVIEESSMVSVELFKEIENAMAHGVQYIFLGDIQQLPPVFGSAILGYKMLELPVVELTEVYRQALESPIIRLAHRILSGVPIPGKEYPEWFTEGKLKIHPWKKKISADAAVMTLAKFFLAHLDAGSYNPETDGILIPFNKSCGTDELNKHIAGAIAKRDQKLVWEIVHGFRKSYYSIGDKCLYDREDAIITNIYVNPEYSGASPQSESASLNYWGHKERSPDQNDAASDKDDDIDFLLKQVSVSSEDDDRVRAASHILELTLLDSDRTVRIKDAGQLNNLILGYAITIHKSQGSEWEKIFLCLHHSHNTMLSRELLYTAVTRPKKELFIICEDDTFTKGINNQRIQGNTLEEKAQFFMGRLERGELQS